MKTRGLLWEPGWVKSGLNSCEFVRRMGGTWKNVIFPEGREQFWMRYLTTTKCELCHKVFKAHNDVCMEHCHTSRYQRSICCRSCNCRLKTRDKQHKALMDEIRNQKN